MSIDWSCEVYYFNKDYIFHNIDFKINDLIKSFWWVHAWGEMVPIMAKNTTSSQSSYTLIYNELGNLEIRENTFK